MFSFDQILDHKNVQDDSNSLLCCYSKFLLIRSITFFFILSFFFTFHSCRKRQPSIYDKSIYWQMSIRGFMRPELSVTRLFMCVSGHVSPDPRSILISLGLFFHGHMQRGILWSKHLRGLLCSCASFLWVSSQACNKICKTENVCKLEGKRLGSSCFKIVEWKPHDWVIKYTTWSQSRFEHKEVLQWIALSQENSPSGPSS